ncbi:Uridylate kinase [Diplodia seriata]|uniref:Uridylate kinase n=1 Tax=Diplodia seriata TaxID=420778 RepID=A0A1S8B8U9_9PEZI|nr:Uridylate kinase [Diplodia seriata]
MATTPHEGALDMSKIAIVGVLGGPGAGKGTQCERLARTFELEHLSVSDVLRAEVEREGSPYASIIRENMLAGRVGPKEITVGILKRHNMDAVQKGMQTFVLDGFPRNLDQCEYFENEIAPFRQIVVLECSESTLVQRLAARGRFDDAKDNVQRRLHTFREATSRVIRTFEEADKVARINGELDIEAVAKQLVKVLEESLQGLLARRKDEA